MKLLELKDVAKSYGQDETFVQALKPTNFSVNAGEFVAVIGPSGSGKTTLLTIIGNLLAPSSGQVLVEGQDSVKLSEKEKSQLRFKKFGFVLQASNLIPFLKVKDQLKLVDRLNQSKTHDEKMGDLLDYLDLKQVADKFPNQLSGGQRQRVAIARALYNKPKVILADEPTANLDTERALSVADLLSKIAHELDCAVIMITHDVRLLEKVDTVYQMSDGQLTLQE